MKVIHHLIISVPDESYSKNGSWALSQISTLSLQPIYAKYAAYIELYFI
jgi:hypothetical protein